MEERIRDASRYVEKHLNKELLNKCQRCLEENGVSDQDAPIVMQSLCYMLLGIETEDLLDWSSYGVRKTYSDPYTVSMLQKMLSHEMSIEETHYGAKLSHWYGDTKSVTIDAGGLQALITYYSFHSKNLGNKEE